MESYFYKKSSVIPYLNETNTKHKTYKEPYHKDELNNTEQNINHYKVIERKKYVRHVNEWLNKPLEDYKGIIYNDDNSNVMVKDVCQTFFQELLDIIKEGNFQINDENQFKEDFIHYVYTLSRV